MTEDEKKVADNAVKDAVEDTVASDVSEAKKDKKKKKEPFCFTDPGCRTDVRFGALLIVAATFLWNFIGPEKAVLLLVLSIPFLWIGVVLQALQARNEQRPGYPWKLAITLGVIGFLMIPDQVYRATPDGPLQVQLQAPVLFLSGLWIFAWHIWLKKTRTAHESEAEEKIPKNEVAV